MNPTVNILGVDVSAINLKMASDTIDEWIRRREARYVCVTGVHGLMESYRNPAIKRVHNAAGMVTPDGMPLVWLSRAMGFRHVDRVYGPDLMLAICQNSIRTGYRHFFYGGAAGIPEKLAGNLANRFQGLDVTGTYSPPFRPLSRDEDESIIRAINETQSDIVWVDMSYSEAGSLDGGARRQDSGTRDDRCRRRIRFSCRREEASACLDATEWL
jgi:N-acetylglucosaminyldiphosphoundecaprenol N-acetyl-beta-D-mannosaminyltransferase